MIRLCIILTIILMGCGSSDSSPPNVPNVTDNGNPNVEPSDNAKQTLAILATPVNNPDIPPNGFEDAMTLAATAGNAGIQTTVLWDQVENERDKYDFSSLQDALRLGKGLKSILTFRVPDTGNSGLPEYLKGRAFDDPEVLQRLNIMIDAALALFEEEPLVICIGNEVDVYLSQHQGELESFENLQASVYSHLRTANSNALLGTTFTYDGFKDADWKAVLSELAAPGDAFVLTYYPSEASGTPGPPSAPYTDLTKIVALAEGKPIILQEFGFATGP